MPGAAELPMLDPMALDGTVHDPARSSGDVPLRAGSVPRPWDAHTPGGTVPTDDDLVERTLAFSGSYASDDGQVTIRRCRGAHEYAAASFTGRCATCARAGLTPSEGEPLDGLAEAAQFAAAHRHGEVD
jgi:hypothetical protein